MTAAQYIIQRNQNYHCMEINEYFSHFSLLSKQNIWKCSESCVILVEHITTNKVINKQISNMIGYKKCHLLLET